MSAQRKVLASAFRDIRLIVYVLIFVGAFFGAGEAARSALEYRQGIDVPAAVVAKETRETRTSGKNTTRFVLRYRLALPDGKLVEAEAEVPRERWQASALGSTQQVRYLLSQARVLGDAAKLRETILLMAAIMVVVLVGSGLLALRSLRVLFARLATARRGVPAHGTVVRSWQTAYAANGVRLWQVRYRYRDANGAEHEADSELLRPNEARPWQPGAAAAILYDPRRPGNSLWLGHAPGEPAPETPPLVASALRAAWPYARNLAIFFAALVVAAVIAELPPLKALDAAIEARRPELLPITLATAIAGIVLLAGAGAAMVLARGRPMSHAEVEDQLRRMREAQQLPWFSRHSSYRFFGRAVGGTADERFSVAAFKRAFRSGAVLREGRWRRRACAAFGALLITLGILGIFVVVSPLPLKLLCMVVLLYILVRVSWAFARA